MTIGVGLWVVSIIEPVVSQVLLGLILKMKPVFVITELQIEYSRMVSRLCPERVCPDQRRGNIMKKIWYGYSPTQSRILFFDNETAANAAHLEATGDFTVDDSGVISGLNVEAPADETVG